MTFDSFVELLDVVSVSGGTHRCKCPAHEEGRNGDLAVREGDEGILVTCHAGCTKESVVHAMGLTMRDLFYDSDQDENPAPDSADITYSYTDEHGVELFQAVRRPGKKFTQRHMAEGEWVYNLKGVRRVLYNLPSVLLAAKEKRPVFICEGEKDVEAIMLKGHVATCNPMGAGKWHDEYSPSLIGASVAIIVDKDVPGKKHAREVRDSLRKHGVEATLLQAKKGKDAFDHLDKHKLEINEFIPFREGQVSTVVSATQMADNAIKALSQTQSSKRFFTNSLGIAEPEWVPGRLYIIGAYTGHGKSSFIGQEFRYQSEQGVPMGLVTNEMTETDFRNRLLCQRGFNLKQLEKPWEMSEPEKARLRTEIEVFRGWDSEIIFDTAANWESCGQYLEDGGHQILAVDHLHNIPAVRNGEESVINKEIGGFASLAVDFDIPIIVVAQFKRQPAGGGAPRPTLQDFKGSAAIEQNAAMAMALWQESNVNAELLILKHRHGRKGYSEYLGFDGPKFTFGKRGDQNGTQANSLWPGGAVQPV